MNESAIQFRNAIRNAGLIPPEVIKPGSWHRFPGRGKRAGNTAGWCQLFPDGRAGVFGDFSSGLSEIWRVNSNAVSNPAERSEHDSQSAADKANRIRETEELRCSAAARAKRMWDEAKPASTRHNYLIKKGVRRHRARQKGDRLVLPVFGFDRILHSLQLIDPDGNKKLLKDGRISGCFIPVAGCTPTSRVLICEGWATGATLAEIEPDSLVLAAINAGNLKLVAQGARKKWPNVELVICADADPVGREKGRAAAVASGALLAVPDLSADSQGSDFNDLAVLGSGGAL